MIIYDYLIVGSGLSGAVFANEASKMGKKCLIIEKRNHVGGNIYCKNIEGITVHKYGAHIFHTSNKYIWDYASQFCDFNGFVHSPIANYKGEIYNLPFNMNTFNKMWGVVTPKEAIQKIKSQQKEIISEPKNLEEQAISLVGRDIYIKLIKEYTEKQWGRSCENLPSFIIKRLPLRFTYNNNYFNDTYQGIPIGGYNVIIEKLIRDCDLKLNTDFNKNREYYKSLTNKVVYTGAIDSYYDYKYGKLDYRSLKFDTEILNIKNYQGVAVVNYTDRETPFTRIIEHKHFENINNNDKTVITKEFPINYRNGEEQYYPVNDEKNQKIFQRYWNDARLENDVIFVGRLAEYRYYDMDKVIESALTVANKELRSMEN